MNNNPNRLKRAIIASSFFAFSATAQAASFMFNVDSTRGWQTQSILVKSGQQLSFSAVGAWNVDYRNFSYVGPDGYSPEEDSRIFQGCKLDPLLPYGRLLVKVGDDPSFWVIGSQGAFTADRDGPVSFRIHDADACLGDNVGSLTVTVTGEGLSNVAPAPIFYCIGGTACQPVYTAPISPPPADQAPLLLKLATSPQALQCVAGTQRLSGLALAGFDFLARFWNNPELGPSSPTGPTDLQYWKVIAQAFVGALTNYGIDEITKKSCFEWAAELTNDPNAVRDLFERGIGPIE
jgi:hypothetical protein